MQESRAAPWHRSLRALDHAPAPVLVAVGLGAGFAAGMGVAGMAPWLGGLVFGGAMAVSLVIARSGEAITRVEPAGPGEQVETAGPAEAAAGGDSDAAAVPWIPAMVDIPAGRFWMGSLGLNPLAQDDEWPARKIAISPFQCMQAPVTRALWDAVMKPAAREKARGGKPRDLQPMTGVTWYDAIRFCNALSGRLGLAPCYRIDADDRVVWESSSGIRLPTEAEWEYACRAGTQTQYSFGDDLAHLEEYAWFNDNAGGRIHPVEEKRPNSWGLHDMHGNVYEWCWDWYGSYGDRWAADQTEDPRGPVEGERRQISAKKKLLRGGAWFSPAILLGCAARKEVEPEFRSGYIGFRCVRSAPRQR